MVDTMYGQLPMLHKDMFWDQEVVELPVTDATAVYKKVTFEGSASGITYVISRLRQSLLGRIVCNRIVLLLTCGVVRLSVT